MENYLRNPDACFYHIKPFSQWNDILENGLFGGPKGISVLRTNEMPIINSVICLQLNSPKIEEENDFVLVKISQNLNHFMPNEIQPDIVFEWTWPLQNNILRSNLPFRNLEFVCRFSILDWNILSRDDMRNENNYKRENLYQSSFQLIYTYRERKYRVDENSKRHYI